VISCVINVNKCSAAAEMDYRLATIDMGQKDGAAVPPFACNRHQPKSGGLLCPHFFGRGELGPHLTQYRLGRGLPPYQVASWSIQPFGHNRHGPKIGRGCVRLGELGPHLTQCRLGWRLPWYQVASWSIQPLDTTDMGTWAENWVLCPFGGTWLPI